MPFVKASRQRAYIKMALTGPSGSGKTLSALYLAQGLAGKDGKIALIDTENKSASLYSDKADFDTDDIVPPFTIEKCAKSIQEAVDGGYTVVVIDSISHFWAGEGGLLAQKESLDSHNKGGFNNWAPISKKQEQFKSALLQSPIHVIVTMRSKQEYVVETGSNGSKSAPRKVGMAPIQREGMEYEFTTVLDISMNHEAVVSKDRTSLFDGVVGVLTPEHGRRLREWRDEAPEAPATDTLDPRQVMLAFCEAAAEHGLGPRLRNSEGKWSQKAVKEMIAEILDCDPYGPDEIPSQADYKEATPALPKYAAQVKAREAPQRQATPTRQPASQRTTTPPSAVKTNGGGQVYHNTHPTPGADAGSLDEDIDPFADPDDGALPGLATAASATTQQQQRSRQPH